MRSQAAVANDVGAKLVLEDLRHVVDGCVQHCDLLAVASEQIEHGRHNAAAVAHERRARLDDDLRAVPVSNETRGIPQRPDIHPLVEQVAASQVDPFDLR